MLALIYDKLNIMSERVRKFLDLVATLVLGLSLAWAFWSFLNGEVVFNLIFNDPAGFRNYLAGLGPWAALTYVGAVIMEVLIAFIPGWFVYPVGGVVFGLSKTVLLVLLGNFLAASISFWVGRKWGHVLLHKFISPKHVLKFHAFTEKHGTAAIFFLKLNPVTSFDIWNYLAGASRISFWKFSIANLLGILPLVAASAFFGEETFKLAPPVIAVLFLATLLYIIWLVIRIPAKKQSGE